MTDENKRANIAGELERAGEVIKAADLLYENGFTNDAVSRLYYYLLYTVRALLLSRGIEPKSHEGALRLFSLPFVKTNIFQTTDSHIFSKLMKLREEADYNPAYAFTPEDFSVFKNEAENLSEKIKSYLQQEGYV